MWVKGSAAFATYISGTWEVGRLRGHRLWHEGQQVVGTRGAPVADPAGGSVIDTEARACIVAMLNRLREHGLIAP